MQDGVEEVLATVESVSDKLGRQIGARHAMIKLGAILDLFAAAYTDPTVTAPGRVYRRRAPLARVITDVRQFEPWDTCHVRESAANEP